MNDLFKLQDGFQDYLLTYQEDVLDEIVSTERASAQERLNIYANAYRLRLIETLEQDYEKLHSLLGSEQFHTLCYDFIDACPSTFRSVRWYGHNLAEFLRHDSNYQGIPILAELAEFEWKLMSAFDAENPTSWTIEQMSEIPPEKWGEIRIQFMPCISLIYLEYNTVEVWQSLNEDKEPEEISKTSEPTTWLIWRDTFDPHFRCLEITEVCAMDAIMNGAIFSEVCELLCEWMDENHVAAHAASLLKKWVSDGVVANIINMSN